jgi:methyl-accepting chemotaxis protein
MSIYTLWHNNMGRKNNMENQAIQANRWIDDTAKICGEVVVDCSDTAGTLENALKSADDLQQKHLELEAITKQLATEIENVAQATAEARDLSDVAREKVAAGSATVSSSIAGFTDMIGLINRLGTHITGFAAAMDQVKRASQAIDNIARTTNMLALNAAIEAQKAGVAGKTFAVVAAEVKKLALDSRSAAVEITGTVNSLSAEAEKLVADIGSGIEGSGKAQAQFAHVEHILGGLSDIVAQVDERTGEIASNTAAINEGLGESKRVRSSVDAANETMHKQLSLAHHDVTELEHRANIMFDKLVHSGMSREDSVFVELAQNQASRIKDFTEKAVVDGTLSMNDLFDESLVAIEGSNPQRFRSALSNWADMHWRPIFDEISGMRAEILTTICSSTKGFLPTHMSKFSAKPTGDFAHDNRYCRNGRVFFQGIDVIAKASTEDYNMAVYRHTGASSGSDKSQAVVRNVYVPLYINGRRWGDLEIAYIL